MATTVSLRPGDCKTSEISRVRDVMLPYGSGTTSDDVLSAIMVIVEAGGAGLVLWEQASPESGFDNRTHAREGLFHAPVHRTAMRVLSQRHRHHGVFVTPTLSFCRVCAGLVSTLLNLELER